MAEPIAKAPASSLDAPASSSSGKRPVEDEGSASDKKPRPEGLGSDRPAWKVGDGQGGTTVKDVLKKEETKAAVSSIKSKLWAPKSKLSGGSLMDKRKDKVGSFSASLTRDEIEASQVTPPQSAAQPTVSACQRLTGMPCIDTYTE